jgi:hypothetical protein
MSNRFWVGGTGNWDASSTTHWSATSGGAGGASVPSTADSVFIDANSGSSPVITLTANAACLSISFAGSITPTLTGSIARTLFILGSLTLISAMTFSFSGDLKFQATTTGQTITMAGITIAPNSLEFSGTGGDWTLQDNLTYTGTIPLAVFAGTLISNNKTIACPGFTTSGTSVRAVNLGTSIINCSGNFNILTTTNLTINAGTSTINMTGASSSFVGGGLTYNNVNAVGNNLTVSGNNTIATFTPTAGNTVNWTSGSNQTITNPFGANGTAGNLVTYQSTSAGSPFTFTKASGTATADYYSIKDSTATGAGTLYAAVNSINAGGNTGWHFITNVLGAASVVATAIVISDSKVNSVLQGSASVIASANTTAYSTKRFKQTLADAKATIFYFNSKTYILDGTNYLQYDGTSLIDVSTIAYVPTLTLGRAPTGGGTANENFNLLGAGFIDSFTSPGAVTTYQLSLTNLDATAITASIDGGVTYNKVETTDFTVNRTTGLVTWGVAPAVGTANNVKIKAFKTPTGYANRVKNCTGASIYGGTNDTRVFFFGNPNYPSTLRRTALNDPTYLPELAYNLVGTDQTLIKGMSKHYNEAIIFKEASPDNTAVFLMSYSIDVNGLVTFPTLPLNVTGCLASGSITTIEDTPIFFGPNGINRVIGRNVSSQRDVLRISDRVNTLLLAESTTTNAVAVRFDQKYILTLNNNAYVYDFRQDAWYLWDNIPANCFAELDSFLYFGSRTNGNLYKFKKATDTLPYNDDGAAINSYWKSKVIAFDDEAHLKNVPKVMVMLKPNSRSSADLYFVTDRTNEQFVATGRADLFDYSVWDYSNFAYAVSAFPQPIVGKIKAKKLIYIQFILRNPRVDDSIGILSISIQHQQGRLLK